MKYLKYFESFDMDDMDDLLDKINKTGIKSLTSLEKDFMKAYAENDENKLQEIEIKSRAKHFSSSNNLFHFYFNGKIINVDDDRTLYYGTMTVPNIELKNGDVIEGILQGSIEYDYDVIILHFAKYDDANAYSIDDFCEGLENELYGFAQDIIDELNPPNID
jgi:hypothetical protein